MKKKIILILICLMVFLTFSSTSVSAASSVKLEDSSTNNSLLITRDIVDVDDNVSNEFTYSISADASNPTSVSELPSTFKITFDNVSPNDEGVAKVQAQLDLSNLTFTTIGNYKFNITEISSSNASIYPVDSSIFTFYVVVRSELDTNNFPTGNLVAMLLSDATKDGSSLKEDVVFESGALTYLTITKNVSGDMANKEEYFKFLVEISGKAGDVYKISGQDSEVIYNGSNVTTSSQYSVGSNNYIYLYVCFYIFLYSR